MFMIFSSKDKIVVVFEYKLFYIILYLQTCAFQYKLKEQDLKFVHL